MIGSSVLQSNAVLCTLLTIALSGNAQAEIMRDPCKPVSTKLEIAELVAEGVLPLDRWVQPDDAVPLGAEIRSLVDGGFLQLRLRVEFDAALKTLITTHDIASASDPLPNPQRPDASITIVLQITESTVEDVAFSPGPLQAIAIIGWMSNRPLRNPADEPTALTSPFFLEMHYEHEGETRIEALTVAFPGQTSTAAVASGRFATFEAPEFDYSYRLFYSSCRGY